MDVLDEDVAFLRKAGNVPAKISDEKMGVQTKVAIDNVQKIACNQDRTQHPTDRTLQGMG